MLAVSSIDAANLVYEIFKGVQNSETKEIKPGKYPNVNVVADFSTNENELIEETNDDVFVKKCDKKAFKRRVIADFNDITGEMIDGNDEAQFSRSLIDNLENNPAYSKNLKGPIQIVIVVDKMLTGFNSDYVNCLFLDKSITSYRLIQATSRTTRVSTEEKKKVGFLIAYRISEKEIEESFSEYSGDKKIKLTELVNNYVNRINEIKECVNIIKAIVPLPIDMDKPEFYENENKLSEFIKHFRILKTLIDIFQRYDEYK
jgi:type I restriction enzyme R subunit